MNDVTITDGVFHFGPDFILRAALLAQGEQVRAVLKRQAKKAPDGGSRKAMLDASRKMPVLPDSQGEKYMHLYGIAHDLGESIGCELWTGHSEEIVQGLLDAFHEGIAATAGQGVYNPGTDREGLFRAGTLEALFFDLGVQADSVMGIALRDDANKQEISMLISNTCDAFANGVESELI